MRTTSLATTTTKSTSIKGKTWSARSSQSYRYSPLTKLKKQKAGYDFTMFETNKEQKKDDKKFAVSLQKKLVEKPKVLSMKDLTQNSDEKKQELLFKKIDQKAQALLEKFKHSTPLSNQLPEQERVRQKIRENLFYALVFGLEECKNKQYSSETDDMRDHIVDISKFLMKDEKSQIEHIKNITLSIEANLYHKYNKDVGKTSAYSNKSRLVGVSHQIFMNLKHKKNFDLRLKVLVEAITPSQLCLMTEDVALSSPQELAPSAVRNTRIEEQEKYLHSKLITEEATFIPKSKKSELLVGAPEDNGLPPLSLETELELETENKLKSGDLWNDDDDLMRDKSNLNNIDKLYEELNPRKLVEKAHVRLKTYLPQEAADQLIQKSKS